MVDLDQHRSGLGIILDQQSYLGSTWHQRAPLSLLQGHAESIEALFTVGDFLTCMEYLRKEDRDSVTHLVHSIQKVLTLLKEVKAFPEVEELFGAVAAEPVQVGHRTFPSANWAALFLAAFYANDLDLAIRFGPRLLNLRELLSDIAKMSDKEKTRELTAREITRLVSSRDFSFALMDHWFARLSQPALSPDEIYRLEAPARQEFFRAWQRFFPAGSKYKTLADVADEQRRWIANVFFGPHSRGRRPAYKRDHQWLDWHEQDKLGPAKIRDRWDGLSDKERLDICPTACERVGGNDPKTQKSGRATVITALKKAQKERMTQTNRRA